MSPARGFSLIELLVVVSIIAVLVAMLIPAVNWLVFRSKFMVTVQRMEALSSALAGRYAKDGGPAYGLGDSLGLSKYDLPTAVTQWKAYSSHIQWTAAVDTGPQSIRQLFTNAGATPWTYVIDSDWGRPPLGNPAGTPAALSIRAMNPLLTMLFDYEGQVLPQDDPATTGHESVRAFLDDRGTGKAWNDRWGNPLIVSYLLFEPQDRPSGSTTKVQAGLWQTAIGQYGYNRALHVVVASAGPAGPDFPDASALNTHWQYILNIFSAGNGSDTIWDEKSFAAPPWQGIISRSYQNGRAIMSAPHQIR